MTQKGFLALLLGGTMLTLSLAACGTSTPAPGGASSALAEGAPDTGENGSVVYFTKNITPEGLWWFSR